MYIRVSLRVQGDTTHTSINLFLLLVSLYLLLTVILRIVRNGRLSFRQTVSLFYLKPPLSKNLSGGVDYDNRNNNIEETSKNKTRINR